MGSWVRYLRYAPPKFFFIAAEEVQSSRIILPGALCIIFLKNAQIVLYFQFILSSVSYFQFRTSI